MADVKISALPAASTPLTGGEVLPVVQSGVTTKVAVSNLTAGLAGTASININGTVGATTPTTGAFTSGTFSTTLGVTGTSTLAAVNTSGSILAASGGNYLTTGAAPVYIGGRSTTGDGYIGVNVKVGVGNYVVNGFAGQIYYDTAGAWNFSTAASGTAGNAVSDTNKMSISNAGAVTIPGTLGVTGKITATAAGIDVPTSNLGMVSSGTYTPTLFNTTNIDSSTAFVCQYMRVGNVVTVSGNVNIDFTAPGTTSLGMSLPIASNFANGNELGGVASSGVATLNILGILADTTNDRAQLDGLTAATINTAMRFSFTYLIV